MIFPGAVWRPGPISKVNGGTNTIEGVVLHSMVGYAAGAMGRLDSLSSADRASWHFSVLQDGKVLQHYHETARCWQAGSFYNNSTIGIEHEGGLTPYDEPLTPAQLNSSVRLVRWLAETFGFPLIREAGLWEHNEVSGAPTACPSNRIPWQYYTEEEMTPAQMQELKDYIDSKFQTQQNWITMRFVALIGWIIGQGFAKEPPK